MSVPIAIDVVQLQKLEEADSTSRTLTMSVPTAIVQEDLILKCFTPLSPIWLLVFLCREGRRGCAHVFLLESCAPINCSGVRSEGSATPKYRCCELANLDKNKFEWCPSLKFGFRPKPDLTCRRSPSGELRN